MKLFLDTNALLDYYVRREPYFESLVAIRIAQVFGDVELWAEMEAQGVVYAKVDLQWADRLL
ncbi:hypothetical protein GMI69_05250 [Eggerthellaceae bacterium zg-887]|uniref:hypothetical protein n=1 Tax=Xiamenia xianingshaonis TaxID=2682776 RepID=UPI00140972C7|nr:hypothetical protein [Xiamenia xianingshaonis]NHM16069.1 hypothetical protein [Xiamenia xianingshaonis]